MTEDCLPPEAHALGRALGAWMEELEQALASDAEQPNWARAAAPVYGQLDGQRLPIVDARSVAAALYSASGRRIAATSAFEGGDGARLVDPERLAAFAGGAEPAWIAVARERGDAATALIAYAPAARTATWRLPVEIHEAAAANPRGVVVLTTALEPGAPPLRDACQAFGLNGLQTRVACATVRTGSIKEAAEALDLSYQTARQALSEAMKRVGAQRLPELVTRLTTLAFGVFPGHAAASSVLADVWGLSERQIAIAGMLAEGASRQRAAEVLGLSVGLVNKEVDAVYALLEVNSGAALARKLAEARALSWLTDATAGGAGFVDEGAEPLRFALRADGGRIAFSDYGPASGKPVLVVHSSMSTRIVSRKLLRALHRAGYRPISIDRPGFGLTDPLDGADAEAQPFDAAVPDVMRVLAHLKIRKIDIVSRGAAQFLVALAGAHPEALGRVVLVNPGPPYRHSGGAKGPLAAIKDAFIRNPATIRVLAPFLAGQLTFHRLSRMLAQWTRGSPPDEKAVQDPEMRIDFFRSVRMFATGRWEGFAREQAAIARGGKPAPFEGAGRWRVLLGASDVLYDPQVVLAYWRELLPGAAFWLAPDGGRFLAMTHADLVVEELAAS